VKRIFMRPSVEGVFMKKCINLILLLLVKTIAISQTQPIGSWQSHASFHSFKDVVVTPVHIIGAADQGVYLYENSSQTISMLTTVNGLSGGNVSALAWDPYRSTIWVGYQNGTIDLVSSEQVSSVTALREAETTDSKRINHFLVIEEAVFTATDLGLIRINPGQQAISEVYREIGPNGTAIQAFESVIFENQLIARTDAGLLQGDLSTNLLDFGNWSTHTSAAVDYANLVISEGQLLATNGPDLVRLSAEADTLTSLPGAIVDIFALPDRLLLATAGAVFSWDESATTTLIADSELSINAISANDQFIAVATELDGIQVLANSQDELQPLPKAGPVSDNPTKAKLSDGTLFLTYRGQSDLLDKTSYFRANEWTTVESANQINDAIIWNNDLYLATPGGVTNLTGDSPSDEVLSAFAVDMAIRQNSLWAAFDDETISLASFDGTSWSTFPPSTTGSEQPRRLYVGDDRAFWIQKGAQETFGFAVWEPDSDSFRQLSGTDGLRGSEILDLSFAFDREVWITTENGIYTVLNRDFIFADEQAETVTFSGEPLLESFEIKSTAIDGGNRKWIGTNDGLWLFDSFVSEQLDRFTTSNSPLPSNQILDVLYEPTSGLLFIQTDAGLVSYQTDSSIPQPTHSEVRIYPNPVRSGFDGLVGINGVVQDATIKIITPEGRLVRQITANGSTASWDLRNLEGTVVKNGIYLLLSASSDGEESFVGKIAVLR
jgi:hypothetical protein